MSTRHSKAAEAYLKDDEVVERHDQTFFGVREKRDRMAQALPEWEDLREAASQIKRHTATHLADYLEQFEPVPKQTASMSTGQRMPRNITGLSQTSCMTTR